MATQQQQQLALKNVGKEMTKQIVSYMNSLGENVIQQRIEAVLDQITDLLFSQYILVSQDKKKVPKEDFVKALRNFVGLGDGPSFDLSTVTNDDLKKMTVAQLKELCKSYGIPHTHKLKADYIHALLNPEEAKAKKKTKSGQTVKEINDEAKQLGCKFPAKLKKDEKIEYLRKFKAGEIPKEPEKVDNIGTMKCAELKDFAKDRGVQGVSKLKKDEVLAALHQFIPDLTESELKNLTKEEFTQLTQVTPDDEPEQTTNDNAEDILIEDDADTADTVTADTHIVEDGAGDTAVDLDDLPVEEETHLTDDDDDDFDVDLESEDEIDI